MKRIKDNKSLVKRAILWILVVFWMGVIFSFSAQNAQSSSSLSGGVVEVILKTFIKGFKELSAERQTAMISSYQFAVRKSAHFLAYMMLGILSMTALLQYPLQKKGRFLADMLICSVYAVTDEIHQLFVPGRSGRFADVCIDSFGAFIGILLVLLIYRAWKRLKLK